MANQFVTLKTIARQALPRLIENLVFPALVHRDFSGDIANALGDTIQVRKPVVYSASEFDPVAGVTYGDIKETTVDVKLDKIATVDVSAEAIETATNINDLNRQFVEPAAVALAEKINSDGLLMYKDVPTATGTAGTTPSGLADFANARMQLNVQKVPTAGRNAIWDPAAEAKFLTVEAIVNAEKSGSTEALRNGSIGRVMGFDNYMAQGVKKHTTGITAATAVKVNGAVTAGATTLSIDGTALTGKLVKGDLMTIGGVNYVVTEDSAAAAANAIAGVKVYPALPAIADDTSVTLIASHTANLAFNPFAFAFVNRPLINPDGEGVASYVTNYNNLSLRVTKGYNQQYKKSTYSMDILYGWKTIYPEMASRVLG